YNITSDGTVIIGYGKKETRIEQISEESITNAIIQVTRDTRKVVYFIQGHGEPDPAQEGENGFSEVKNNLEKLSYRVKKLVLLQETTIPEDASVLVIAGPQQPLFKKELGMIEEFINHQNGQVFFMLNPGEGEELKPLLKKLGIRIEDDVIVDTVSTVMGGDYFIPVVANYPDHAITRHFNYATFFPLTRSLSRVSPPPGDVSVTFVASTSPNSWGEQQYAREIKTDKIVKNPEDKAGPLDIIAAIELKKDGDKTSRVAVSGDSDFVINKYYYFSANGNLFNNIISWLADEGDLVAISARTATPSMLTLTRSDSQLLFYYTMIILPLLVFMVGIGVWLYRRKL
ncbi:MAG: Gldg family protein, partial [Candidatus Aminicenantes bacterium]|nr:Gldg family protein [Candidatus Aminicenantes bacterium]